MQESTRDELSTLVSGLEDAQARRVLPANPQREHQPLLDELGFVQGQ